MSTFSRKTSGRKINKVIRIFTEGEKTEPNYFGAIKTELRLSEIDIKIHGIGDHTMSLVDYVINEKKKEDDMYPTEWWVVFDKDDHSHFNQSIEKAQSNGIQVAYSNESFELWFILHYDYLDSALTREKINEKLEQKLGRKYAKSFDIYPVIKDKESEAIRNAKNLEKMYDESSIISFEKRNPSTTVYKLVEALRNLKN